MFNITVVKNITQLSTVNLAIKFYNTYKIYSTIRFCRKLNTKTFKTNGFVQLAPLNVKLSREKWGKMKYCLDKVNFSQN